MSGTRVQIAVTGLNWMGGGYGSVDTALETIIRGARQELQIVAYTVTTNASFVLDLLEARLDGGVRVSFVVNRLAQQPGPIEARLRALAARYSHFQLFDFNPASEKEDLHAKFVVADRTWVLIGSANLSFRGLVNNHELALVVEGYPAAQVATAFDRLVKGPQIVRVTD